MFPEIPEAVFFALGLLTAFALLRLHAVVRRWQRRLARWGRGRLSPVDS